MHTRLLLLASIAVLSACNHSGLSRQLAESVHRDYPSCRDMHGQPLDQVAGTWSVDACGVAVTYECPTGPGSRWRGWHGCQQVQPTAGGVVVVAQQQQQ